ncbi:hypothetical protein JCM8547_005804 [Rhodosporidiobolus lusitaniae]
MPPSSILKNRPTASCSRSLPPPPASPSSGEPSDDLYDSEEDEWETERTGGGGGGRGFEQDEEEDEGMSEEEEREGVAAYESDEGEYLEESDEGESAVKQLAQIPFGMVLKAQKQLNKGKGKQAGKKGKGRANEEDDEEEQGGGRMGKKGKGKKADVTARSNKHAPMEQSAKRPVSRVRQIVDTSKPQARDPRFDSLSGSVRSDLFKNSYGFLADAQRQELEKVRATYAAAKKKRNIDPEVLLELEETMRKMENREVNRRNKNREQEALSKWKKEERAKQKEGKKAFHLKSSAKKDLFAKAKYEELSQDKRKLHKAMDKKRKKLGQKEKKLMPNARPGAGGGY